MPDGRVTKVFCMPAGTINDVVRFYQACASGPHSSLLGGVGFCGHVVSVISLTIYLQEISFRRHFRVSALTVLLWCFEIHQVQEARNESKG